MSRLHLEYDIKRDIRNIPIVREVDKTRRRQLWRAGYRRRPGRRVVVLGLAALRTASPRVRHRADGAGTERGARNKPALAPGNRNAAIASADRADRDRGSKPRGPDSRRLACHRADHTDPAARPFRAGIARRECRGRGPSVTDREELWCRLLLPPTAGAKSSGGACSSRRA